MAVRQRHSRLVATLRGLQIPRSAMALVLIVVCFGASPIGKSAVAQDYASSVVGTDFDIIRDSDPSDFQRLELVGKRLSEMPDKRDDDAELMQPAFVFQAHFETGQKIAFFVSAEFQTTEAARAEALRYASRLGKLPTPLRDGVKRLVIHHGGPRTTAFSDIGLIVVYSENATKRIATHDLEETLFHESVHATWDKTHASSAAWQRAQASDGVFITSYGRKNPSREDLAESALFAFALTHHSDRIPAREANEIRRRIPARIAFIAELLPAVRPKGNASSPTTPQATEQNP